MAKRDTNAPEGTISSLVRELAVDRRAEVPICVQLGWSLRTRIADGRLASGERLPGLREVAEATGVNVNTVRVVYQRLENAGLIVSEQGRGTFVGPAPLRPSAVGKIAEAAANEARETGVDPREVAAALYVTSQQVTTEPQDTDLERRKLLRIQIGALERTLGELEATYPGLVSAPRRTQSVTGGPILLGNRELEQVRTDLLRRLTELQTAIDAKAVKRNATVERRPRPARTAKRKPARATVGEDKKAAAPIQRNQLPATRPAPAT